MNQVLGRAGPGSRFLLRVVAALAARDRRGVAREADADGAPAAVALLVGGAVGEAVDRAEVRDHALVRAREVFEALDFVEEPAARLGEVPRALAREVEGLGLDVERAEGFVLLGVRPDRVEHAVELLRAV